MTDLCARVERALAAIEADDPTFAEELRALAALALPDLAADPGALDGRLFQLFAALRRLRPLPVWASGDLQQALATRDAYGLDGALVEAPLPEPGSALPRSRGRELYWRVGAADLAALSSRLPAGVGVVVDRPDPAQLDDLRRLLRGRALGVAVDCDGLSAYTGARLDLLVVVGGSSAPAPHTVAIRTMARLDGAVGSAAFGVIVPAPVAPTTALRLAGHRHRAG